MDFKYEFDPIKAEQNFKKHGVSFDIAQDFDWENANVGEDDRNAYTEKRFEAISFIDKRLYVMIFCMRLGKVRIISLRKANRREIRSYHENTQF
jgi:hypothetical protein